MGVRLANNAFGTLANNILASDTTITLTAGHGARFPALSSGQWFYATLVNASNELEIIKVTARSGDVLTVQRAQDGTTARAYAIADRLELRPVAAVFNDKVDIDRKIETPDGSGLIGGGDLSTNRSLSLANSGVTPGTYGSGSSIPRITVDGKGRVTMVQNQPFAGTALTAAIGNNPVNRVVNGVTGGMWFSFSQGSGNPPYLWGTDTNGQVARVWSPSNLSVGHANTANTANSVHWNNVASKPAFGNLFIRGLSAPRDVYEGTPQASAALVGVDLEIVTSGSDAYGQIHSIRLVRTWRYIQPPPPNPSS